MSESGRDNLLKPQITNGKKVSFRKIHPGDVYDRLRQKRVNMIIINNLTAFYQAEGGFCLRRWSSSGLGDTDRNGVVAVVAREIISLCGCDAYFPVERVRFGFIR